MKRTKKRVNTTLKRSKVKDTKEDKQYTREELESILNERHKQFAREYCTNAWNGTQAYKKVYSTKGNVLSNQSCAVNGHKLLTNTNIQQYVDFLKQDIESLTGVSKEKNLKELAKIAYAGIAHLNDSWIDLKEYNELTDDEKAAIKETKCKTYYTQSGSEVTEIHIVLHPKLQAIETINKMMGYNATEQIKVDQTTTTKVDITKYTDEEKALLLKMARKNEYQ